MSSDRLDNKPQSLSSQRLSATNGSRDSLSSQPLESMEPPIVATLLATTRHVEVVAASQVTWPSEPLAAIPVAIPVAQISKASTAGMSFEESEGLEASLLPGNQTEVELPEVQEAEQAKNLARPSLLARVVRFPFWLAGSCLDLFSLLVLLSIVAAIPVLQLASLGYLLTAGGRLAAGQSWRTCLPGLRLAGKLGVFGLWASVLFLPVILIQDLAQSAQILQPNSQIATVWRLGAVLTALIWIVHVGWAAMRGGRWWHLLWPAPLKFVANIWRPKTWSKASDQLYDMVVGLQLPKLWWLGARASVGVLMWLVFPVSMMIIGQRAPANIAPLIGLVGAGMMIWAMYYLPFLQMLFVKTGKLSAFLAIGEVRRNYAYAPWAHFLALLILSTFAIPLYLLRIEDPPQELMWAPSLIFALLILPSKLVIGWVVGYAERRQSRGLPKRRWFVRWPAHLMGLGPIAFYVGALYVAQLVVKLGAPVMYLQHAFLVPSPF